MGFVETFSIYKNYVLKQKKNKKETFRLAQGYKCVQYVLPVPMLA
jgi:hypothetical protein